MVTTDWDALSRETKGKPYLVMVDRSGGERFATEGMAHRFASRFIHATAHVFRNGELIAEYGGRGPREAA